MMGQLMIGNYEDISNEANFTKCLRLLLQLTTPSYLKENMQQKKILKQVSAIPIL